LTERNWKIAAVGDNCIDLYDQTGMAYPGGNPVNVAVYTVRMGGAASYTGVVGDDSYGELMRKAVAGKGVDVSHLHTLPGQTAVSHVSILEGDRVFGNYEEGVMAQFKLTEEDEKFLCSHDLIVSGLWGMIENDLPGLKEHGVPVAFDFADKENDPVIDKALPYVDYAFFSRDEKTDGEIEQFMRKTAARGPKIVVVTRGEKGSMAFDGERIYKQGIVNCSVEDTMGAGDSFIAGFLFAQLEGRTVEESMAHGAWNSSVTLGYKGAW